MNRLERLLCKCGFHKFPSEEDIIMMARLQGKEPYPLTRTCLREGCGRCEQQMDSSQGLWWSIENRGIQKLDGRAALRATWICLVLFGYLIAVFHNYIWM